MVSLDLDPGAKQKVEALKQGSCEKLSYESDIRPWIGDSLALAVVPFTKGKLSPVAALAITDQDKAARDLDALIGCSDSAKGTGYAFDGDWKVTRPRSGSTRPRCTSSTRRPSWWSATPGRMQTRRSGTPRPGR